MLCDESELIDMVGVTSAVISPTNLIGAAPGVSSSSLWPTSVCGAAMVISDTEADLARALAMAQKGCRSPRVPRVRTTTRDMSTGTVTSHDTASQRTQPSVLRCVQEVY